MCKCKVVIIIGNYVGGQIICPAPNAFDEHATKAQKGFIFIDLLFLYLRSHYDPVVDSACNRNEYQKSFLGVNVAVRRADNLTTFLCRLSRNSGASTFWNSKGLLRPVAGKLYLYSSFNLGVKWKWVAKVTPLPLYPATENGHQLYRRMCGPHGRSGLVRKVSPSPGFDSRSLQPLKRSYTD
jgi:hypothetical protein